MLNAQALDLERLHQLDDLDFEEELDIATSEAHGAMEEDDNPEPWKQAMHELAQSPSPRVRAWVAAQGDVPVPLMEYLLFEDPDTSVRAAAGGSWRLDYFLEKRLKKAAKDRIEAVTTTEQRAATLTELAGSLLALERHIAAEHPDLPQNVRERMVRDERDDRVRKVAVANSTDEDLLVELLDAACETEFEEYTDDYNLVLALLVGVCSNRMVRPEFLDRFYFEWNPAGRCLKDLAANPNCPTKVLDDVVNLELEEYESMGVLHSVAWHVACHRNARQATIDWLLQDDDLETRQAAQDGYTMRQRAKMGPGLPGEREDDKEVARRKDADSA